MGRNDQKIVWGVPIATVAIGLLILLFACLQPSHTATVNEVGETAYTQSTTMVRGHSSSYYSVMLEVECTTSRERLKPPLFNSVQLIRILSQRSVIGSRSATD